MLLVHGLGAQLIDWPAELLARLVAARLEVVIYDHRDAGGSTHLNHLGLPDLLKVRDDPAQAPYLLSDLADDAAGLLAAIGVTRAHVVGVSMGGMVAQELAIRHRGLVATLCSIMSSTGDPSVGQPTDAALAVLLRGAPSDRAAAIEQSVAGARVIASPSYGFDEATARANAAAKYDRAHDPAGVARQLAAIVASPDRTEALRRLELPALVVHGTADPLVQPSGGEATAAAIPGAELRMFAGMGHDLPGPLLGEIATAIVERTRQVTLKR